MRLTRLLAVAAMTGVVQFGCTTKFNTATDAHTRGNFALAAAEIDKSVPTPKDNAGKTQIKAAHDKDRMWAGLEKAKMLSDAGQWREAAKVFHAVQRESEFLRHIESAYASNPADPANWDFGQFVTDAGQLVVGADQTPYLLQPHEYILCNTYLALDLLLAGSAAPEIKLDLGAAAKEARRAQQFSLEDLASAGYERKAPPESRMDGKIGSAMPTGMSGAFKVGQVFTLGDFTTARNEMRNAISEARAAGAANPAVAFSSVVQWAVAMRATKSTDALVASASIGSETAAHQLAKHMEELARAPAKYPFVLVLVDAGMGPTRRAFNVRLPIVIPNVGSAYFRAVYPALQFRTEARPYDIRAGAAGSTETVAVVDSIDAITALNFQRREAELWWLPTLRAGLRTAASVAAQIAQANSEDKTISILAQLGSVVVAEAEQPDLRIWSTLPATQHAAIVRRPTDGKLRVDLAGGGVTGGLDVDLPDGSSIVYVRALTPTIHTAKVASLITAPSAGAKQASKPGATAKPGRS
jgi:hypothetical protein